MNLIQFLYSIFGTPLGYVLYFIYTFIIKNVGIGIILFTFIIKGAMIPLYIKQQKSTAVSAAFAPKIKEIQTKYANNRERQQQELMKLQQQGYKPTAGCLPMLLSFVILFGVIDVVYKPLTHIVHSTGEEITAFVEESYNVEFAATFIEECAKTEAEVAELDEAALKKHNNIVNDANKILAYYNENCLGEGEKPKTAEDIRTLDIDTVKLFKIAVRDIIAKEYAKDTNNNVLVNADLYRLTEDERKELNAINNDTEKEKYKLEHSFSDETVSALGTLQNQFGYYRAASADTVSFTATSSLQRELYSLESFGTQSDKFVYKNAYSEAAVRPEARENYEELYENLNFIGIPLGQVPASHMGFPMILVPIVSFLLSLTQTVLSNHNMKKNNPEAAAMGGSMKIMMYIMPLFSLWLAFTVPAGAGFYWAVSYAFGILQTLILDKLYNPRKLREAAAAELAAKDKVIKIKAEKEKNITQEEALSQKEANRRRLAEARKADALKYGEEYNEDDGDDD
ncbi:MAG: YidC/Oxa1 family membrane protein insertase [Oscillospiraceae bacterium]|nr:YidC/Oxa1 family membrane protein insertase [Oscillospiraceae bacterium]